MPGLIFALIIRHRRTAGARLMGREPLVRVASRDFAADDARPLPLALDTEGYVYRARALTALAAAGRDCSVAVTSQSPVGINVAVQSGLAVTVKALRAVPDGCRVLDSADGMPELGDIEVALRRPATALSPEADRFEQVLRKTLAAAKWLRPAV